VRLGFADFKQAKSEGKYATGLPLMELPSGASVTQSIAMVRYAGKLGSLYPTDPEQALVVDEVMDVAHDALGKCPQDPDDNVKKTKREEYAAGKLKDFMNLLSERLSRSGGPFYGGDKLTVGDLVVTYFLVGMISSGDFDHVDKSYVDTWPNLVALEKAVTEHAVVAAWYASRA